MKIKVVVDTNIVFSALLNRNSRTGKILLGSTKYFRFYACDYLKVELSRHRNKLIKLTRLTIQELDELEFLLIKNITFINESLLPVTTVLETVEILRDVDINDVPFAALTKHLDATLWTGDKELIIGIEHRNFIKVLTTTRIVELLENLEQG